MCRSCCCRRSRCRPCSRVDSSAFGPIGSVAAPCGRRLARRKFIGKKRCSFVSVFEPRLIEIPSREAMVGIVVVAVVVALLLLLLLLLSLLLLLVSMNLSSTSSTDESGL